MSMLLGLLAAIAAGGSASATPGVPASYWNPAAEYVTIGQDEPGYRFWLARSPDRRWGAGGPRFFR